MTTCFLLVSRAIDEADSGRPALIRDNEREEGL
jgi:hypothetical protein